VTRVVLYMEGGGQQAETKARLRQGIGQFLGNGLQRRNIHFRPKIVVCGSVQNTFKQFNAAILRNDEATCAVLVDADGPVSPAHTPARHLSETRGWQTLDLATDEQIHLMVQTMEAWIIADRDLLVSFYGRHLDEKHLTNRQNVEDVPKAELEQGLKDATRRTQKGAYHKINHASQLLQRLNSDIVAVRAPHFKSLLEFLVRFLRS